MKKGHIVIYSVAAIILLSTMLSSCTSNSIRQAPAATGQQNININSQLKTLFAQSLTLLQAQEYDEAIALLETFTRKEKRLTAPFVNLGMAYSRTGRTKKAEQNFITALRLDIGHAVANNELGLLYRKTGRFGAARAAYQNALTMHPDYLPVRKNMGILCEIYLHDLECAVEQYQAYLEYKPDEKKISSWVLQLKQRLEIQQSQSR